MTEDERQLQEDIAAGAVPRSTHIVMLEGPLWIVPCSMFPPYVP